MSRFFDTWGFLHDKENNISGNPLVYSAYWKALTGQGFKVKDVFYEKMFHRDPMTGGVMINRHPTNLTPTSLDEIVGGLSLDLINAFQLKEYGWRWYDNLHSPPWYRVLQAMIYCAGRDDRHFFKDKNVRDLNVIAYNTAPQIRYYAWKLLGKTSYKDMFFFYAWVFTTLAKKNYIDGEKQTGNISQKNMVWLVLKDLKSKWLIKFIDYKKNFNDYFKDPNHPIRVLLNETRV